MVGGGGVAGGRRTGDSDVVDVDGVVRTDNINIVVDIPSQRVMIKNHLSNLLQQRNLIIVQEG